MSSMQLNGIQLNSKPGTDFNSQYNVPDTALTQTNTLPNNPLYNLMQVLFQGKQTDNIAEFSNNDIFLQNGLKPNIEKGDHKLFTQA